MAAEMAASVKAGDSTTPAGGVVEKWNNAVKEANTAGEQVASANGWSADSPTVQEYKKIFLATKMAQLAPAPASAPAVSPLAAAWAAPSGAGAGGTPNVASPPSAPPIIGGDISGVAYSKQEEIFHDLKAMPTGKYLSDPKEPTYGNLLALASAHGTTDQPLSVMQVLKSIDNAFATKNGVTNTNKWENEFVDWLKTPDGKKFADANPTPDANLVKSLKGVYDGPSTDMAELAKKVKIVPGPGAFDAAKPSSDFKIVTTSEASALRKQMLASNGGQYTPAELSGISIYTSNDFTKMNSYLRGQSADLSPKYKKAIKDTQDAMRPLPQDVLLHRGTGWSQLPEGFNTPEKAKKLIGKTIMDEAFVSTSVGGGAAFGGALKLEIEAPKGTHAAYVEGVSTFNGEREMLLAAGQHFQILSVTSSGGQTVLRMRVVDAA
jgi:hypothetical protein